MIARKILIIDDEEIICLSLQQNLHSLEKGQGNKSTPGCFYLSVYISH